MRRRQFLHPTGSGMQAELQFVEGKTAANIDDELAIKDKFLGGQVQQYSRDVREVTREGLARFRLQINVVATPKSEAAETIPFRLVLPTGTDRNFINRLCFHRQQRRHEHGCQRMYSIRRPRQQTRRRPERNEGSHRSYLNTQGMLRDEMGMGEVPHRLRGSG